MNKIGRSIVSMSALFPTVILSVGFSSNLFVKLFEPKYVGFEVILLVSILLLSALANVIIWVDYTKRIFK